MATHVIIDSNSFQRAQAYYSNTHTTRTKTGTLSLTAGNAYAVAPFNLLSVLDRLLEANPAASDNLVIVCHGTEQGMSFQLAPSSGTLRADREGLNELASGGTAAEISSSTNWALAESLTQALIDKMQQVRQLNLTRVELRGCKIGSDPTSMQAIREFFGANTVGAPVVRNAYARIGFVHGATQADFDRIQRRTGGQTFTVASGQVGFVVTESGGHGFDLADVWATSADAVRDWRRQMFYYRSEQSGPFAIHGQFITHNSSLVFPKQAAYTANLAENASADDFTVPGFNF